ncbi:MAG: hypothetical protein KDC53_23765 [Saprospiraceae bacterium]|nr:hypothetical protein [Saprospiraceae bacterium]
MNRIARMLCLIMFYCVSSTLFGQLSVWDGESDNNWHQEKNWMGDTLPALNDSVVIDAGTVIIDDLNVGIKILYMINGSQLTNNKILSLSGSVTDGIFLDGSTFTNNMQIEIFASGNGDFEDRAIEMINGSIFNNFGGINIKDVLSYGIRVESSSVFTNSNGGTILITSHERGGIAVTSPQSTFENNGDLYVLMENGVAPRGVVVSSQGSFFNHNTLKIDSEDPGGNTRCMEVVNGGHVVNTGSIDLNGIYSNRGISLSGTLSSFDIQDGHVNMQLDNAQGIVMSGASIFSIDSDANLLATGTILGSFMEMEVTGTFECQGILQLGN